MMNLEQRINEDLKTAMRAKDQAALRGIRAVKAAIQLAKTEEGASKEISSEREIQILQKLVKQRQESLSIYEKQNREDLAVKEREEIEVIQQYLPKQLTEEELETHLRTIIERLGARGMQDMGKVMNAAGQELAGRADGKTMAVIVRRLLT